MVAAVGPVFAESLHIGVSVPPNRRWREAKGVKT